jgi:hypothetical protein
MRWRFAYFLGFGWEPGRPHGWRECTSSGPRLQHSSVGSSAALLALSLPIDLGGLAEGEEPRPMSAADRRREIVDATLESLRHTVGRDEHMPHLHAIVAGRVGPVTFAEIAEALVSVNVSGRDPEWRAEWAELIETVRRAAVKSQDGTPARERRCAAKGWRDKCRTTTFTWSSDQCTSTTLTGPIFRTKAPRGRGRLRTLRRFGIRTA